MDALDGGAGGEDRQERERRDIVLVNTNARHAPWGGFTDVSLLPELLKYNLHKLKTVCCFLSFFCNFGTVTCTY